MSNVYTITQMKTDEGNKIKNDNKRIANEYLVGCGLHPDEDIKKIVLSANKNIIESVANAFTTSESLTPGVAKLVVPGLAANVKILQSGIDILANEVEVLEQEVEVISEQRNALQTRLVEYENSAQVDTMLHDIREGIEKEKALRPKQSQRNTTKRSLSKAVARVIHQ